MNNVSCSDADGYSYNYKVIKIVLICCLILHRGYFLDRMSLYLNGSRTRDSRSKPYESLYGKRMYLCFISILISLKFEKSTTTCIFNFCLPSLNSWGTVLLQKTSSLRIVWNSLILWYMLSLSVVLSRLYYKFWCAYEFVYNYRTDPLAAESCV